ncbi:SigE family RNA polymerase sigma factor [Streptomyces sp. SID5594]|uniref:SigE family RNA polymerase sigma factor n=1 Tax=Streptomyces TaxID=1883 RepID=UPI00037416DB|nr:MULTISPECIES: SigE family RNA polymerase sigma factor [unclassified Streptomyces]MZF53472.1 SigE family RNA polymerase sigma factor [Streptomyces sp. SID5594]
MPAGAEPEGAADGGSVAAFEAYARDGQRRLYRTAYLLCGNVEGAKDLTQTTLAKLFQHWRRASRADNLDAYAKTVLVRTYVAERRRSVRDLLAHRSNPPRSQADPASGVDLRVTLLALLDELPPRARAMVVLRYWDDLSVESVASLLRCSESTVKSQCSRSLVRLRARLGDARLYSTGS